ncbi:MAG: hypothetical protein IJU63_04060 [Bacteroidales bacterium]|nr:hypothetical protein [Bacteroidales bacterium]
MKFFRYTVCAALCLLALFACKKEEEEAEIKPSLIGSLTVPFPSYVLAGQVIDVSFAGITHPEGKGLGFVFKDPLSEKMDTVRRENDPPEKTGDFQYVIPDTLGTFSVSMGVFADGYYSKMSYGSFTVIKPGLHGGALTNHGIAPEDLKITAPDGQEYYYARIGSRNWFRQNVRKNASGISYNTSSIALDPIFGRYYTWEEARSACPDGWRLPTENDWVDLAKALGCSDAAARKDFTGLAGSLMADAYFDGKKMWVYWQAVPITDASHFCALPTGYALWNGTRYAFRDFDVRAVFWTADESGDDALYRSIYQNRNMLFIGAADKQSFAASVRCVQDAL